MAVRYQAPEDDPVVRVASDPCIILRALIWLALGFAPHTHWSPVRPAPSRRWMLGSATFTIVMSSRNPFLASP
jgi:hypothetical protein